MYRSHLMFAVALAAVAFAARPLPAQEVAPTPDYGELPEVAERYLARTDGLVAPPFGRVFFPLIELPYDAFAARWDSLRAVDEEALASVLATADVPARFAKLERARIAARWARGHVMYPYFHWRETGADSLVLTPGARAAAGAVDRSDAELLELEDFRGWLDVLLHEEARRRVREDVRYASGAARWTRAKYDAAVEWLRDPAVRGHALAGILLAHVDQLGGEHLAGLLRRASGDIADSARLAGVRATYDEERAGIPETRPATYKEVDDVELRLHIRRPENASDSTGAAFVWFHGGSWNGAWYRCAFLCTAALRSGMTVVQVEYRTADGFDATPLDALADARDAIVWLRRNGAAYGVDAEHVVAAGFSSGATLALMTGLGDAADPARPDAIVSVGGCADPTEDGWFRQSVGRSRDPSSVSPAHNVSGREPPTLLIHGTADEYCPFEDAAAFAQGVADAGGAVRLQSFADRPHFFLFMSPEDRAAAVDAIDAFLDGLGDPLTRAYPAEECPSCSTWNQPAAPVHLFGDTYWVGTRGLGAVLITSSDGHVLIDGGLPNSAPLILANVRALGFEPADIELMLNSHAHYDHAGGFAALQRATGAPVAVRAPSVDVIRTGTTGPSDPQHVVHLDMPAVADVRAIDDTASLRVAAITVTPLATGGHTPGGTSWTWRSCEGERCLTFVYADSQTPISDDDFHYTGDRYPTALADFERGHALLESAPCDLLLTPHPGASDFWERAAGGVDALVDGDACRRYAAHARQALAERLERERQPSAY